MVGRGGGVERVELGKGGGRGWGWGLGGTVGGKGWSWGGKGGGRVGFRVGEEEVEIGVGEGRGGEPVPGRICLKQRLWGGFDNLLEFCVFIFVVGGEGWGEVGGRRGEGEAS